MANTTNFNWETPDDTDLVKDGAAAIRTLGSAIDTSLVDLKGGTTGQALIKASNTDMDFSWSSIDPLTILDAKGDLITATAADTPARLAVGTNGQTLVADSTTSTGLKWATPSALTFANSTVNTSQTTTSTTFTDLTTVQATTITTGTKALVILTAKINNNGTGNRAIMSFAVSGSTTIAANDTTSLQLIEPIAGESYTIGSSFYLSSLTAGSNTFTAKFRTGAGTAGFSDRQITIIDLGS